SGFFVWGRRVLVRAVFLVGAKEGCDFPCGQSGEFARTGPFVAEVDQVAECGTDSGGDLVAFIESVENGGEGLFAPLLGLLITLECFAGALARGQSLRRLCAHGLETRSPCAVQQCFTFVAPRCVPDRAHVRCCPIVSPGVLTHLPTKSHTQPAL